MLHLTKTDILFQYDLLLNVCGIHLKNVLLFNDIVLMVILID